MPELRARYLDHVRTLAQRWLDWRVLSPIVEEYRAVLGGEIAKDTKKLYSTKEYDRGIAGDDSDGRRMSPSLRRFAEERRKFLLSHAEIARPRLVIRTVRRVSTGVGPEAGADPSPEEPVVIVAQIEAAAETATGTAADRGTDGVTDAVPAAAPGRVTDAVLDAGGVAKVESVVLHHAEGTRCVFDALSMLDDGAPPDEKAGDGVYTAPIRPYPAGTLVRYYVEGRGPTGTGAVVFDPAAAEARPRTYRVRPRPKPGFAVRINEVMTSDATSVAGAEEASSSADGAERKGHERGGGGQTVGDQTVSVGQQEAGERPDESGRKGDHQRADGGHRKAGNGVASDWIELHNTSDEPVDLCGLFLSDDPDRPRKWRFPDGAAVAPGGFLLVWADGGSGDSGSKAGIWKDAKTTDTGRTDALSNHGSDLHAGFQLSREGESLWLVDRDDRGNSILDSAVFGKAKKGVSLGRLPDGRGELRPTFPTRGAKNQPVATPAP